jgi:phosphotriesterase-related protein
MSDEIASAAGPVPVDRLGSTLMHEHVFLMSPELHLSLPTVLDTDRLVDLAVRKLAAAKAAGVDTIVDATVVGQGRNAELVARVAARSEVNILMATGVFLRDELPGYFRYRSGSRGAGDAMSELFVRDLTEGIGNTGVRAAVLKCATERRQPGDEGIRAIAAVARAQKATGAPVITHTSAKAQSGRTLADIFLGACVNPGRVVLGHSGDTDDLSYLRGLLDDGFVLGMDRFGYEHLLPDETRIKVVAELCRLGYADQLVLSHDSPVFCDYFTDLDRIEDSPCDFTRLGADVIPRLLASGVSEKQLTSMLVDTPRRLLAGDAASEAEAGSESLSPMSLSPKDG